MLKSTWNISKVPAPGGGSRPFLDGLQPPYLSSQPPKTIISYLNDQASAASARKFIILTRLSISMCYSSTVNKSLMCAHTFEWSAHGEHASLVS